jgi:hypothetical protein
MPERTASKRVLVADAYVLGTGRKADKLGALAPQRIATLAGELLDPRCVDLIELRPFGQP